MHLAQRAAGMDDTEFELLSDAKPGTFILREIKFGQAPIKVYDHGRHGVGHLAWYITVRRRRFGCASGD
jgi:hypothetical protein